MPHVNTLTFEPNISYAVLSATASSCPVSACWRREAVSVLLGGMWVALRPVRWADAPFQETHGREAFPVHRVLPLFLPLRPPGPAHEETPELVTTTSPFLPGLLQRGLTYLQKQQIQSRGLFPSVPSGDVCSSAGPRVILFQTVKRWNIIAALFSFHIYAPILGDFFFFFKGWKIICHM